MACLPFNDCGPCGPYLGACAPCGPFPGPCGPCGPCPPLYSGVGKCFPPCPPGPCGYAWETIQLPMTGASSTGYADIYTSGLREGTSITSIADNVANTVTVVVNLAAVKGCVTRIDAVLTQTRIEGSQLINVKVPIVNLTPAPGATSATLTFTSTSPWLRTPLFGTFGTLTIRYVTSA